MNVKYVGNFMDHSGYGEAARRFALALDKAGVNVIPQLGIHGTERLPFNEGTKFLAMLSAKRKNEKPQAVILHVTPDVYPNYITPGIKSIGHFFWETTQPPGHWIKLLNKVDEVWTGCDETVRNLQKAGVKKPLFVTPEPTKVHGFVDPIRLEGPKRFIFYSIFQWTRRKNPQALLRAYWREFKPDDEVLLVVKTYRRNVSKTERIQIFQDIRCWADEEDQDYYPPVWIITELLTEEQVGQLHATGDCYVTAGRGEGWGLPLVDAMKYRNPCITIRWNGVTQQLTEDLAYLVEWDLIGVTEQPWMKNYHTDQQWANPEIASLQKQMRKAYQNPDAVKKKGQKARAHIKNFSFEKVGKLMKKRLKEIL